MQFVMEGEALVVIHGQCLATGFLANLPEFTDNKGAVTGGQPPHPGAAGLSVQNDE
jgi:hypothetical protein